jgi:hypothetical protein
VFSGADGTGFEPAPEPTGKAGFSEEGGAKSGALGAREAHLDADLDTALADWLDDCPVALDDETKAGITRMVRSAGPSTGQEP